MTDFLFDPIVLGSLGFAVLAVAGWFFIVKNGGDGKRIEKTSVFVFNRDRTVIDVEAKTFDGLVTYETGGFVENAHCILPVYYGRGFFARDDNPNSPRKRYYTYLTRPGDGAPLDARNGEFTPDKVSKSRFESFAAISAERAVNEGKLDAAKGLLSERLLAIGAFLSIVMVVITWGIVIALPLTPLAVKSELTATADGQTQSTPGNSRPIP